MPSSAFDDMGIPPAPGSAPQPAPSPSKSSLPDLSGVSEYAAKVIRAEGNPSNLGTFTKESDFLKYARLGRPDLATMPDDQLWARRSDPLVAGPAIDALGDHTAGILKAAGLPVNDSTKYAGHWFGPDAVVPFLKADPNESMTDLAPSLGLRPSDLGGANGFTTNLRTAALVRGSIEKRMGGPLDAASTPNALDDAGIPGAFTEPAAGAAPASGAPAATPPPPLAQPRNVASPSTGAPAAPPGTIWDAANGVLRRPDGSIASTAGPDSYVPVVQPDQQPAMSTTKNVQGGFLTQPQADWYNANLKNLSGEPGSATYPLFAGPDDTQVPANAYYRDTKGVLHEPQASSQAAIAAWQKAHPLDVSNQKGPGAAAAAGPIGQGTLNALAGNPLTASTAALNYLLPKDQQQALATGVGQGIENVGGSIAQSQSALSKVPGLNLIFGPGGNVANAEAGNLLVGRNANDTANSGSLAYQGGKFGGEVLASAPFMAGTEGLGGLVDAGVAGSRFAPLADFAGGRAGANNWLLRVASRGAQGAVQGAEATPFTYGGSSQPFSDQLTANALTGGALGAAGPFAGAAINKLAGVARTVSPPIAEAAAKAPGYGITLDAGQVLAAETGSKGKQAAKVYGQYAADNPSALATSDAQPAQITRAALASTGSDAQYISPAQMTADKARIGGVINDIVDRTPIQGQSVVDAVSGLADTARKSGMPAEHVNAIGGLVDHITKIVNDNDGEIPGDEYKQLTAHGAPLDRITMSSDPNFRDAGRTIRDSLDDAIERSAREASTAAKLGAPAQDDAATLATARRQYKNLMTLAPIVQHENVTGLITPQQLETAVSRGWKGRAFQGADQLGDIAKIAQLTKPPPAVNPSAHPVMNLLSHVSPLGAFGGIEGVSAAFGHPENWPTALGLTAAGLAARSGVKAAVRAAQRARLGPEATNLLVQRSLPRQPLGASLGQNLLQGAGQPAQGPGVPFLLPLSGVVGRQNLLMSQPQPGSPAPAQ